MDGLNLLLPVLQGLISGLAPALPVLVLLFLRPSSGGYQVQSDPEVTRREAIQILETNLAINRLIYRPSSV